MSELFTYIDCVELYVSDLEPFDIPFGKCAVVQDKWENEYVILDMSKGMYVTDDKGNVIGVSRNP